MSESKRVTQEVSKIPIDPSVSSEHLTPNGKRKRKRISPEEKEERRRKYEVALDVIPLSLKKIDEDAAELKSGKKKQEVKYWWQEKD